LEYGEEGDADGIILPPLFKREYDLIKALKKGTFISGLSLVLLLLLPAAGSCGGPASPQLAIVSLSEGTVIASPDVPVSISVANFNLTDSAGQSSDDQHQGRVIYYLDVTPPTHQGWTAMTHRGSYVATTDTTYTWHNVRPGWHVLGVQLVTGDNKPLTVPRVLTINVNVVIPPRQPVTANLIASNGVFDLDTITVPAGAEVLLTFVNADDTPHNFSLYASAAATQALFQGEAITGPDTIVYKFTAPAIPGDYFFRSDSSPDTMTGTLRVTAD
jgi:plastocyanin